MKYKAREMAIWSENNPDCQWLHWGLNLQSFKFYCNKEFIFTDFQEFVKCGLQ